MKTQKILSSNEVILYLKEMGYAVLRYGGTVGNDPQIVHRGFNNKIEILTREEILERLSRAFGKSKRSIAKYFPKDAPALLPPIDYNLIQRGAK